LANDVMIEARGLSKLYGSYRALDRVSFEVRKGEVVGFLGPNGAGKSTTMRILTCFISATGGSARVHGLDVFDDPLVVRQKIGYLPQRAPLYGEMTVWDYLKFCADMRNLDDSTFRSRMKRIVEVCGLARVLGKDIRTLSHGYRQRVGLGQALVHDPPILILDEPTSDLDPNEKAEVIRYIQEIGKNRTVLLSTHNLAEVEAACARAIIVSKGRVVADGPLDTIRAKGSKVRYLVTIHEKRGLAEGRKPPSAQEAQQALAAVPGITNIRELPTDDSAHSFELKGPLGGDARPDIFQLVVQKGWLLLEMRRETQTLEDVFKALTRGDEIADRGGKPGVGWGAAAPDDDEDEEEDEADDEEVDDSEADDEEADDEDDEAEEKPAAAAAAKAREVAADEDDEEDDEEDEEDEPKAAEKPAAKPAPVAKDEA
jgi:ABC-2 type transport system ATP-binding protein